MKVDDLILLNDTPVNEILGNIIHCLEEDNATFLALKEYCTEINSFRLIRTIPFSSDRKYSGAVFEEIGTCLMGAYEFLFPEDTSSIKQQIDSYSKKALRVLVLAHSKNAGINHTIPNGLIPCVSLLQESQAYIWFVRFSLFRQYFEKSCILV